MVGCELNPDPPSAVGVENAVPAVVVVGDDATAEHACPEGALGGQVGGVEHDDLSSDLHSQSSGVQLRRVVICSAGRRFFFFFFGGGGGGGGVWGASYVASQIAVPD